ncbi:non-ribosomal peptide synthetase [Nocardioides zeae]|uniref:Amino acid adenylation domain-containing protein n=1 Tax=Nocardioides zeae TaxID=1457234 RepID=A0AAJ1U557_9ACTN|nr:non-ribosomal peptide synthetase [Nocardioides zeae]MDQ1105418.1 amino acid adenylation domain-containing protein [Nocardioides zeae]
MDARTIPDRVGADDATPADGTLVATVLAEQLGRPVEADEHQVPLAALGVDSLVTLRWRGALERMTGVALPLVAMTGERTLDEVTAAWHAASAATSTPASPPSGGTSTAEDQRVGAATVHPGLTEVQAAYWAGRADGQPLGGVGTWWYHEYVRGPAERDGRDLDDDLDRLERGWRRVVARHAMLRTVVGRDAAPRVVTHDVRDLRLRRIDLREVPPGAELDRRLAALRDDLSHQVRVPESWPLCEVVLVLLPGDVVRVCVGLDALVVDFAGWGVVLRDWGTVVADPRARLPEPPTTFAALLEQRDADVVRRQAAVRAREWWAAQDLPAGPSLARSEPAPGPPRFRRLRHVVEASTWAAVRAEAAARGVSTTSLVLTAFALLLQRRSTGGRDLGLTLTVYDRPDAPGADEVVGDFSGTALLPVRGADGVDAHGPAPFVEQARSLNRVLWDVLDHRAHPGVAVVRERTEPGAEPRWPVVFTSGLGQDSAEQDRWLGDRVFGVSQTPQVLLDHLVWEEHGALVLVHDVVEGAYPDGLVEGLAAAEHAFVASLADPGRWDERGVVWDPSGLAVDPVPPGPPGAGPLLHDPWRAWLAGPPVHRRAPAVLGGAGSLDHGTLHRRAEAVALALADTGVAPGDLVMVALPRGHAQVVTVLGIALAGAGYVPVDPGWPARRLEAAARKSALRHAVVLAGQELHLPAGVHGLVVDAGGEPTTRPSATSTATDPRVDDLAYVIFTSGSTGEPKGVAIEHRQARTTIDDVNDRFGIGPDDRVLGVSALSFDLSVHDLFGVLGAGGAVVLPDAERARDPQHWLDLMARHDVTVWNSAPPLMEMLVEYAEFDPDAARAALGGLRVCLLSGDWIPVTLPDRLRALAPQVEVHSLGGATEASIWSVTHPVREVDPRWPSIPYGRPLRGQSFLVLDEEGSPTSVGIAGELAIGGAGVARGYVGDPTITADRFVVHPALGTRLYRTGDLGRWRTDGTLEFLGRADRQVKIGGHRIELGEVEVAILRHPDVRQAVVSSMPGPDGRGRLVAHVARHGGRTDDGPRFTAALLEALGDEVPTYMVPARVVVLPSLPMSANGKIDVASLTNPFDRQGAVVPPAAEPETEPVASHQAPHAGPHAGPVAALLADLLGPDADLDVPATAAGLTSLQLVRIANAVEDSGRPRPALAELLGAPSLTALALRLDTVADVARGVDPDAGDSGSPDGPCGGSRPEPVVTALASPAHQVEPPAAAVVPARERSGAADVVARLRALADALEAAADAALDLGLDLDLGLGPGLGLGPELRAPAGSANAGRAPATSGRAEAAAVDADDDAPLTEMQLAYLVGRAPEPDGRRVAPHYYTEALVEDLDVGRLQDAWRTVVARHPMLRAVITSTTTQRVLPDAAHEVEVADHRVLSPAERQRERERIRAERSHRLLATDSAPMARLLAVRLGDTTWRLHLDLDLLFCDARSACTWVSEMAAEYARPGSLPARPAPDFLAWARRTVEPSTTALAWADSMIARLPPAPVVPRVLDPSGPAAVVRRRTGWEPARWARVRRAAQQSGVTVTALLLDALGDALTDDDAPRATVVLTVDSRPAEHDGVVGDYTSTLLLEIGRRRPGSANRVQERLVEALDHGTGSGGVHGNALIRRLRASGRSATLPVAVSAALEPGDVDPSQLLDLLGRTEYAVSQTPQVLVDVQLFDVDGRLEVVLDADESRVDPTWVDTVFGHFTQAVARLVDDTVADASASVLRRAVDRTRVEGDLAAAFAELGVLDPGDRRSWFDLGATSLTLVTAHRRLRERGHALDVVDLFAHPSPAATMAHLVGVAATHPAPIDRTVEPSAGPSAAPSRDPGPAETARSGRLRRRRDARHLPPQR